MAANKTHTIVSNLALAVGALAVLAAGADHLEEYAANQFSTVPTIGTLFLLNFVAATVVGVGLLLTLSRISKRLNGPLRELLALAGIGIAVTSLIALWIGETSSLFGFTDYGFRPAIVAAVLAESTAIVALSAYLALTHLRLPRPRRWLPSP